MKASQYVNIINNTDKSVTNIDYAITVLDKVTEKFRIVTNISTCLELWLTLKAGISRVTEEK
jgi:hypothetical protein